MDATELLKLLNETPEGGGSVGITEQAPPPEVSETVIEVDRWGHRRAEELAASEWNEGYTAGNRKHDNLYEHSADHLADAHAACFEPQPQLADNPSDTVRAKWYEQLLDTPDFRGLHASTTLDTALSEIGAKRLADQYREYVGTLTDEEREDIEGDHGDGPGGESIETEMKRIRSTTNATAGASEDVSDARDAAAGLGMGDASGSVDYTAMVKLFQRVRNDDTLRRICELAGRYRRVAQSRQSRKSLHGVDDTVGIELNGDVGRLIPAELAALSIPELELDTLRRIAERQAMCRQYQGVEPVAKGSIVVCVDESGSMRGNPIEQAKAMALSLGWVAKHQNRWIGFVGFSGGTEGTRVAFPPGKWDQEQLIEWLTHFYSGGTTLDVPLHELPTVYWAEFLNNGLPRGKTDVILITDAIVSCPEEMAKYFLDWKERERVKCYGIIIGSRPGDLDKVCDRTWTVGGLDVGQECVSELLSI